MTSTEHHPNGERINYSFDLERNYRAAQLDVRYKDQTPTPEQEAYARTAPLVHGTTLERLMMIIESGSIMPIAELDSRGISDDFDRMELGTDELDRELGMDNFTFWSLGRAKVATDAHEAFLVVRSPEILESSLAAFEDMAEMGAVISPEWREQLLRAGFNEDFIETRNRTTMRSYFRSLMQGEDFSDIFARYLNRNHQSRQDFLSATMYPYDQPKVEDQLVLVETETGRLIDMRSAWGGPQILLGTVSMEDVEHIAICDFILPDRELVTARLGKLGLADKVVFITDYAEALSTYDSFTESLGREINQHGAGAVYHPIVNSAINLLSDAPTW